MQNIWILTEERPKISVIQELLNIYCQEYSARFDIVDLKIHPRISKGKFMFVYDVEDIIIEGIGNVYIKTVSGSSSFLDFLVFLQQDEPMENGFNNLIFAVEETKTSDSESRNTGVYQRASKFVFIDSYYKDVKTFMLYNEELEDRTDKKPSDTSIFGTNMLLTAGVEIVGKEISRWFKKFDTLDEMVSYKKRMRKPPAGNVPIEITKFNDRIEVSGRLAKPAEAGNIGHDPNIGALSIIVKCIRTLGWTKDIYITQHGVSQKYVNSSGCRNKFLFICKMLDIKMEGLVLPKNIELPEQYWHYERSSEKIATILTHVLAEYKGLKGIYENHAGCERGYFKNKSNKLITLPKKDKNNNNLYIPDLVLYSQRDSLILVVEGKKLSTLNAGVEEINYYDSIENDFIRKCYPECKVERWVTLFGGNSRRIPHEKVLLLVNDNGDIIVNEHASEPIKRLFA